ncbi:MAG: ABC-F family ATP-binding cassette domain-containing protein [Deltaproteobacteria bacterium]|nr:ABC-F family ATP-binding cassette domain-containing protein [Deltaproteobacteria bacterium]
MIGISKLAKSYADRILFEDVSFSLNPGSRYGLVGANGSGKTTFLRVVSGEEPASDGVVSIDRNARVAFLRQDRTLDDAELVIELAMMGDAPTWNALSEQRRIAKGQGDPARLHELEDVLRLHDGYTLESRAGAILDGLGIPVSSHRCPLATLSGGFKLRVLLAQVLLGGPDVLLLDEPTNHLDILSIRWLEKFLASYKGCAVIISHDQRFLDNVATHILDVDYETVTLYVGNYAAFSLEKQATLERKQAEQAQQEKLIADKRAFVERFRYKATKARQAQSRIKQLEKIEVIEIAQTSRRAPALSFEQLRPSGRDVLEIKGLCKAYGDHEVLRNVSLSVRRGDKLAVIGPNGLGKSTLLKILVERVSSDDGTVEWGHEVRTGYFPQDHAEVLDGAAPTPLEFLWSIVPNETPNYVRSQLGRVLLSGSDVDKSVGALSGGEAARLLFAKLAVERPNVLVLDEPTNHLDLESIHALIKALRGFEGTVIFVSHDRYFVSELATRILELTATGPRDYPGTYAEYLAQLGDDHLDADAVVLKAKADKERTTVEPAALSSWETKKRERNRRKELPARRDKVMAEVEAAEERLKAILDMYVAPGFFERTSQQEVAGFEAEQAALKLRIETLMAEWEAVEREIAELASE